MPAVTFSFQHVTTPVADFAALSDINDSGVIIGTVDFLHGESAGFYGPVDDFTEFSYPTIANTQGNGINASGEIVGSYQTGLGTSDSYGYILDAGEFSSVQIVPDATFTYIDSINDAGDIAGYYVTSTGQTSGFTETGGTVSTIDLSGQNFTTEVVAIDNAGDYAGNYTDVSTLPGGSSSYGFAVIGGVNEAISIPGSYRTTVTNMNNVGDIVGYYFDTEHDGRLILQGGEHGFIYHEGQYETIDYPGTTGETAITGINDDGQIVGSYDNGVFLATPEATPCYCRGTLLLTPHGEVPVEALRIGDRLVTLGGADRPIRWIGRRSYAGRFVAGNRDLLPVAIRAGALADGVPRRDLFVSPLHAMHLDGMLIPAAALVNGASIRQIEAVEQVDYFHVELDTHDVILAEGAASETFVDDDSRGLFHNAAEYRALYPDAAREPARFCAPRVEGGEALDAVLRRIEARTRPAASPAPAARLAARPGRLLGKLESVDRERIVGWAHDPARPERPVRLRLLDNGMQIALVTADGWREDLLAAGMGDGLRGFEAIVPGGLAPGVPHVIEVRDAGEAGDVPGSPWTLAAEPSVPLSAALTAGLDGYVDELTRERISGWVRHIAAPEQPVALQILDNGVVLARVLANRYRPDLKRSKHGSGRHGFAYDIPGGLSPLVRHVISFRREPDGCPLDGPPFVIEAADGFTPAVAQAIAQAVGSARPGPAQDKLLGFLAAQTERLLRQRADAEGRRSERQALRRARRDGRSVADPGRRALVIDERVPVAGRDAGSQAVLSHMAALRRLGYAVSFAAAEEMMPAPDAAAALAQAGIACCGAPFHSSVEDVLRRQADCFDVIYLHRAEIAASYLALARRCNPRARIVYSVADLHHVRLERQAAVEDRPELLAQSRRMRLAETVAACAADAVITHSPAEVAALRRLAPQAAVRRVTWDVPVRPATVRFAARHGIAFIGAYSHAPNVDAAHWLVEAVMPLVWAADPSIACLLVGTDMPRSVRRLARSGVVALGRVDDLGAAVFDTVRLTVAPLRYGAGVNGKVLASLAAGVPCAMSPIAAEGLPLCATLQGLVGQDAPALAALIGALHADRRTNARAAAAGTAMIRRDFGAAAVTAGLRDAIGRDGAGAFGGRAAAG